MPGRLAFFAGRAGLAGALLLGLAAHAAAATPLEIVQSTNEAVFSICRRHSEINAADAREVLAIIDAVTDYQAFAGGAIDAVCPKLTAAQCATFKEVFTRLLRISSLQWLGRARAGRFEYKGEKISGESAVVRTVVFINEESVSLDYQLARRGTGWVIVNYVVDDVDTVRSYRKQFSQLLAKKTFEQVVGQLERKIAALEKKR